MPTYYYIFKKREKDWLKHALLGLRICVLAHLGELRGARPWGQDFCWLCSLLLPGCPRLRLSTGAPIGQSGSKGGQRCVPELEAAAGLAGGEQRRCRLPSSGQLWGRQPSSWAEALTPLSHLVLCPCHLPGRFWSNILVYFKSPLLQSKWFFLTWRNM